MKQYMELLDLVISQGSRKTNRTGVDTIGVFGAMAKFDLRKGFPLLTSKKMAWKAIVHELLWFISGSTHIKYLLDNNVHIWDQDAYNKYKKAGGKQPIEDFINDLVTNYPEKYGDLGYGTYGSMWRNFPRETGDHGYRNNVDQLKKVIATLLHNPDDRRMIVTAWHPGLVDEIALPPCHVMFQFNTELDGTGGRILNLCMFQRSCDLFLGVPFNIASYSLLLKLVAHCVGMTAGTFTHFYGDLHIYVNHLDAVNEQMNREMFPLPSVDITGPKDIDQIKFGDIHLRNYNCCGPIKAELNTGMKK